MKISEGTKLEFLFAIFFIIVGFNIDDSFTSVITILISILVIAHCIYLWIKKKKDNNPNNNSKNRKVKSKKIYITLLILSLILNIALASSNIFYINKYNLNNKNNKKLTKKINNLKKDEEENRKFLTNRISELYNKATFYDKYIVIIPENTGYYYTYDCWDKNGRSNNFKIMNWKDAKLQGYIQGTC